MKNLKQILAKKRVEFNTEMYAKTKKYQKKYGFEIGTGEHDTWNNESDAFKHVFMQAITQFNNGTIISNTVGAIHEFEGSFQHNQPANELNMDLWNNEIGRDIGNQIKHKIMGERKSEYSQEKIEDMIANEIVKRMKNGDLITSPSDIRSYKDKKLGVYELQKLMKHFGLSTGYATDIPENKIFTAEEIGKMSSNEFVKNESAINKQLKSFGVPREFEAQQEVQNGTMIWVDNYTRDDGVEVRSYYRRR